MDGRLGLAGGALEVAVVESDLDDVAALGAELVEVAPLVLLALAADEVGVEVDPIGPLELAARDGQLERRQVRAGQERVEVGRREDEAVRPLMHLNTLARTQEASPLYEPRWRRRSPDRSPVEVGRKTA